jgi:ABC-type nitrate/sulfonate/bicarbonate transport system substrate-binding protein
MRKVAIATMAAVCAAWVVVDANTAADKIRVSVTNFNMSFLPSGLAVKRGFFKDEAIEAVVIRMNANVAITALASGDTDHTMIFGSVVRAAIRGLPVRVVASLIDGWLGANVKKKSVTGPTRSNE